METLSSVCWRCVLAYTLSVCCKPAYPYCGQVSFISWLDLVLYRLAYLAQSGLCCADTSHLVTYRSWIPLQPASIQDWCEPSP